MFVFVCSVCVCVCVCVSVCVCYSIQNTQERLKEHFLMRQNRTKRANFQGCPLFQATCNKKTEKQTINSTYLVSVGCRRLAEGKGQRLCVLAVLEKGLDEAMLWIDFSICSPGEAALVCRIMCDLISFTNPWDLGRDFGIPTLHCINTLTYLSCNRSSKSKNWLLYIYRITAGTQCTWCWREKWIPHHNILASYNQTLDSCGNLWERA